MVRDLFNVPTKALWGPSAGRTPEIRAMLQELGDYARKYRPDIWVDKMDESLSAFAESGLSGYKGIVIADIRFEKEIEYVHEMGGTVIRVIRPGNAVGVPEELAERHSETSLEELPAESFDITIINDGTLETLKEKACAIVQILSGDSLCH